MVAHEAHEGRSPAGRPGSHRLLPIALLPIAAAVVAVLVHLGGGALLVRLGLGVDVANLGGGALVVGLLAVVAAKLLIVFGVFRGAFGARRWLRHR